jgi:hypothetical protein
MRVIWVVFFISPVVYLIVAHLLFGDKQPTWETDPFYPHLRLIFVIVSAMGIVFQQVFATILTRKITRAESSQERVRLTMSSLIVRAAIFEAIALYGLVLVILFGRFTDAVYFSVVSLALMPLCFPLRSQIEPVSPAFPRHDGS